MLARAGGEAVDVDDLARLGHAHPHPERRRIDPHVEIAIGRYPRERRRGVVGQAPRELLMGFARALVDRAPRERDRFLESLEPLGARLQFGDALVERGEVADLRFGRA